MKSPFNSTKTKLEKIRQGIESIKQSILTDGYILTKESFTFAKRRESAPAINLTIDYSTLLNYNAIMYLPFQVENTHKLHGKHGTIFEQLFSAKSPIKIHCSKCGDYRHALIISTTNGTEGRLHLQIICKKCQTYWNSLTIETGD